MLRLPRLHTLLIILVMVASLPSAVLLVYAHAHNQQQELDRTRADLEAMALLAAAHQEQLIAGVKQILATVASGPSVRRSDLASLCREFLVNVANASPVYASMGVLDRQGNPRCIDSQAPPFAPPQGDAFLAHALAQRDFSIAGFVVVRESGRKALAFSMPVFDYQGEFSGLAYAALELGQLDQQLKALQMPNSVRVFVTDPAGLLLASSKDDWSRIGIGTTEESLGTALLEGKKTTFDAVDSRGIDMLHALVPAGPPAQRHLLVRVSAARDDYLAAANFQLRSQLFILIVVTLGGVVLASMLAQWQVARPVARLLRRMDSAGRGDFLPPARRAHVTADFAQVDMGFSNMLQRLHQQQVQMLKVQEVTRVGFYDIDLAKGTLHISATVYTMLGLDPKMGPIRLEQYEAMIHPQDVAAVQKFRSRLVPEDAPQRGSFRVVRPDGEVRYLDVYATVKLNEDGHPVQFEGALQDMSEERRQRRLFQMQSRINEAIVRTRSSQELFEQICQIAVEVGALPRTAVVGAEPVTGALYRIARAGHGDGYEAAVYPGATLLRSDLPVATAMREGVYTVCNDIGSDDRLVQFHPLALQLGFRSVAITPLMVRGKCVAAVVFTADQPHFFQDDENRLFQAIGDNLSYALTAIEREADREAATNALRLTQAAVDSSGNGIMMCEARMTDMTLVYVNRAFEQMTGYSAEEVLGKNCRFLQGGETNQPGLDEIRAALREGRGGEATLRNVRRDGSVFWNNLRIAPVCDAEGAITHYVGVQTDVTERIHYEEELAHQAHYDALTSLPNRQLLEDRLGQAIAYAQRANLQVGIAFLDLDNFKIFNDSIGHAAGDHVLCSVAERLSSCLRPSDTVARLGGDEFVIVMGAIEEPLDVENVVTRVQRALEAPIVLEGKEYFAAASIGLAMFPRDGATVSELIQRADFAMYKAKDDGRGVMRTYDPSLDVRGADRLELERALRKALAQRQFTLHYQPQCDALTGVLVGREALIRWNHPELGMVSPQQFIPLAEQTGVIVPLGEWVIEEACRQNQCWHSTGHSDVPVAVNVSGIQFRQGNLLHAITAVLKRTGLPAQRLHIEVTESVMMNDPEEFIRTLNALRAMGVGVALDDFGTGYSSLSYLKRFPIDHVKIDKSFVRDITSDPMDAGICSAIIAMAHNLGMQVIAEGVETAEQAQFLRERGCDQLQGYLVGRPLPAGQTPPA